VKDEENMIYLSDKEIRQQKQMYYFTADVQNDNWVSGGWATFQRTTVLPGLNSRALHQG
jgi:hypothetical protein